MRAPLLQFCVISFVVNLVIGTIENYSGGGLSSVPSGIPTTATELLLNDNALETLGANEFSTLTALTLFDASENKLHTIDGTAFSSTLIVELNLNNNELTALPGFTGFTTLKKLYVKENKLITLDFSLLSPFASTITKLHFDGNPTMTTFLNPTNFAGITKLFEFQFRHSNLGSKCCDIITNAPIKLRLLYLANNTIESSHLSCLVTRGFTRLIMLDLGYNNIDVFPDFHADTYTNLKELWIGKNQLTSLDSNTDTTPILSRFTNLRKLLVWNNQITEVDRLLSPGDTTLVTLISYLGNNVNTLTTDAFDGITTLTNLDLSHNALVHMPGCLPDFSLTTLKLDGNEFECDCGFRWLLEAVNNGFSVDMDNQPCTSGPAALVSETWANLQVSDLDCTAYSDPACPWDPTTTEVSTAAGTQADTTTQPTTIETSTAGITGAMTTTPLDILTTTRDWTTEATTADLLTTTRELTTEATTSDLLATTRDWTTEATTAGLLTTTRDWTTEATTADILTTTNNLMTEADATTTTESNIPARSSTTMPATDDNGTSSLAIIGAATTQNDNRETLSLTHLHSESSSSPNPMSSVQNMIRTSPEILHTETTPSPKEEYMQLLNATNLEILQLSSYNSTSSITGTIPDTNLSLVDFFYPPALVQKYEIERKKKEAYEKPVEAGGAIILGTLGIILVSAEVAFMLFLDTTTWIQRGTFCVIGDNCRLRGKNGLTIKNSTRSSSSRPNSHSRRSVSPLVMSQVTLHGTSTASEVDSVQSDDDGYNSVDCRSTVSSSTA